MNRLLLIVLTLALLAVSFSISAPAGAQNPVQSCAANLSASLGGGHVTDLCATCLATDHNARDVGACVCKLFRAQHPDAFAAQFSSIGQCVSAVQQGLP